MKRSDDAGDESPRRSWRRGVGIAAMIVASQGGCTCSSQIFLSERQVESTRFDVEPRDVRLELEDELVAWGGIFRGVRSHDGSVLAEYSFLRLPPDARVPAPGTQEARLGRTQRVEVTEQKFYVDDDWVESWTENDWVRRRIPVGERIVIYGTPKRMEGLDGPVLEPVRQPPLKITGHEEKPTSDAAGGSE